MFKVLGSLLVTSGGALGFGVPPPPCQGYWGPYWSHLGGSGIWGPPFQGVLGSLLVRFGVWGRWDLGCPPPHQGVLGFHPPCQSSWGPYWSDLGGSGIWGPRISRGLWIPVGQIWGPPPHIRGSWGPPPMSEVLGSLFVRFGGLWDLGSPLYKRFCGLPPCSRCTSVLPKYAPLL